MSVLHSSGFFRWIQDWLWWFWWEKVDEGGCDQQNPCHTPQMTIQKVSKPSLRLPTTCGYCYFWQNQGPAVVVVVVIIKEWCHQVMFLHAWWVSLHTKSMDGPSPIKQAFATVFLIDNAVVVKKLCVMTSSFSCVYGGGVVDPQRHRPMKAQNGGMK